MSLEGKTALVTGAAHGQGRAHAVRLAKDGADVILLDICEQSLRVGYPLGTWEELQETQRLVEAEGRRAHIAKVDVRDRDALAKVFDDTATDFPRLDVIVANAGISSYSRLMDLAAETWDETIGVNLSGPFNVIQIFGRRMVDAGNGGSVVIISSSAGIKALPFCGAYSAAKHGLQGLAKAFAQELGPFGIRVNTINPAAVNTVMGTDETLVAIYQDPENAAWFEASFKPILPLGDTGLMEPDDVANSVSFLASDESKYITGGVFAIDAGVNTR